MFLLNEKEQEIIEEKDCIESEEKETEKGEKEIEKSEEEKKKEKGKKFVNELFSDGFYRTLFVVSLAFAVISIFFAQVCVVRGDSMLPTFKNGDVIVIEKITKNYDRMDVVVVNANGRKIIKRIIALPGEEIQIKNGKVFVNGEEIEDVVECETAYAGIAKDAILLGDDEYFVLGDNRKNSLDSRDESIGIVKEKKITGKMIRFSK